VEVGGYLADKAKEKDVAQVRRLPEHLIRAIVWGTVDEARGAMGEIRAMERGQKQVLLGEAGRELLADLRASHGK